MGGTCPRGYMSSGVYVLAGMCPGGKCQGVSVPGVYVLEVGDWGGGVYMSWYSCILLICANTDIFVFVFDRRWGLVPLNHWFRPCLHHNYHSVLSTIFMSTTYTCIVMSTSSQVFRYSDIKKHRRNFTLINIPMTVMCDNPPQSCV